MTTKRKLELSELERLGFTENASKVYSNSDYAVFEVKEELEIQEDTYIYNVKYCIQIGSDVVAVYPKFQGVVDFYEDEYKQTNESEEN